MIVAVVQAIGFSNSFNNPIVYAFMNESFKKSCVSAVSSFLRRTRVHNVRVHFTRSRHATSANANTNTISSKLQEQTTWISYTVWENWSFGMWYTATFIVTIITEGCSGLGCLHRALLWTPDRNSLESDLRTGVFSPRSLMWTNESSVFFPLRRTVPCELGVLWC